MAYRIGVMQGDDIGLEIVPVAVDVLRTALKVTPDIEIEMVELPIGRAAYKEFGTTLPDHVIPQLEQLHGCIMGPIGHAAYPSDPNAFNPHPILRRHFGLHSNIRPSKSFANVKSLHGNVDLVIVRENNQGFMPDRNVYAGKGEFMPTSDMAMSVRIITKANSQAVAQEAFEFAALRDTKKKVTAVHKASVHQMCCGLFLDVCRSMAEAFPDVAFEDEHVDTFATKLLLNPQKYDVIVTTNMFGDIFSNIAGGLVGSLGLAPGLNVSKNFAMAQASHGSAPDIAGEGVANPFAMIMSVQMLVEWLGRKYHDRHAMRMAGKIREATFRVIQERLVLTPDLGGQGRTKEFGEAVVEQILSARA